MDVQSFTPSDSFLKVYRDGWIDGPQARGRKAFEVAAAEDPNATQRPQTAAVRPIEGLGQLVDILV